MYRSVKFFMYYLPRIEHRKSKMGKLALIGKTRNVRSEYRRGISDHENIILKPFFSFPSPTQTCFTGSLSMLEMLS